MKTPDHETKKPTTPEERRIAKKAKKDHRARVRLVIETTEWLIRCHARAGKLEKCQEMAAEMMRRAEESPEDFGRWKSVVVQVASPPETPQP